MIKMESGLNSQFGLDPRTKILILIILSFMVFNDSSVYISGMLVLIPFICLFLSDYKKAAIVYIVLFILAKYVQIYILPTTAGILSIILITFSYTAVRMLPIVVMGYYTIKSTKVSEFIASMQKSNIPKEIIIPLSVVFRYVPSIIEEIKSISDAMKMRGFGLTSKSLKNPLKLIEFYMVPILISAVKTADELSAASLTRGLSNPEKRTSLVEVRFNNWDYLMIILAIAGLGIFSYSFLGGVLFA